MGNGNREFLRVVLEDMVNDALAERRAQICDQLEKDVEDFVTAVANEITGLKQEVREQVAEEMLQSVKKPYIPAASDVEELGLRWPYANPASLRKSQEHYRADRGKYLNDHRHKLAQGIPLDHIATLRVEGDLLLRSLPTFKHADYFLYYGETGEIIPKTANISRDVARGIVPLESMRADIIQYAVYTAMIKKLDPRIRSYARDFQAKVPGLTSFIRNNIWPNGTELRKDILDATCAATRE